MPSVTGLTTRERPSYGGISHSGAAIAVVLSRPLVTPL
jgi:hypothetical protein